MRRAFSKIYAMAGLRIGYAIAQKPLIERLARQQAYNAINLMAAVAASRKRNRESRAWLVDELQKLGYRTPPSEANFVRHSVILSEAKDPLPKHDQRAR